MTKMRIAVRGMREREEKREKGGRGEGEKGGGGEADAHPVYEGNF